jgi:NADH-quinone oxidoreductase subunit M
VVVVAPLIALSLFLGLYPKPALDRIQPSVKRAVNDLERKTDYREPHPPGIANVFDSGGSDGGGSGTGSK